MGDLRKLLSQDISWTLTKDVDHPFSATFNGTKLVIRVNDFPNEELYSLVVGDDVVSFSDWPKSWERSVKVAAKPKVRTSKATAIKLGERAVKSSNRRHASVRRKKLAHLLSLSISKDLKHALERKIAAIDAEERERSGGKRRPVASARRASIARSSSSRQISKSPES